MLAGARSDCDIKCMTEHNVSLTEHKNIWQTLKLFTSTLLEEIVQESKCSLFTLDSSAWIAECDNISRDKPALRILQCRVSIIATSPQQQNNGFILFLANSRILHILALLALVDHK